MTYQETLDYLFTATPVFQHIGGAAYKPGLATMQALDNYYQHPHRSYHTIHVGGTNGKGSTSHTLAAILQCAGYRVGLFTSPHLVDFRERIRVNGEMISKDYVCQFTEESKRLVVEHQPSFFELTSMMAMCYFREQQVDIAIIEVGLGGRLDSTNIISPMCSVITNISLDHTQYLGNTLAEIAFEKAGIIKSNTPVIIGQAKEDCVRRVFEQQAKEKESKIVFATDEMLLMGVQRLDNSYEYETLKYGTFVGELSGEAQVENTCTILATLDEVQKHLPIPIEAIHLGFAEVVTLTGLLGRWQTLQTKPTLICDTGHNEAGIRTVLRQIARKAQDHKAVRIVLGMASDKDVRSVLDLFPRENYVYYFTQASVSRALAAKSLYLLAQDLGIEGRYFTSVQEAVCQARAEADDTDLIFVGGSNFVVADLLQWWQSLKN